MDISLLAKVRNTSLKPMKDMERDDTGAEKGLIDLTFGAMARKVLNNRIEGDDKKTPVQLFKLGALSHRINQEMEEKKVVSSFTSEELKLITDRLSVWPVDIVFGMTIILDPEEAKRNGIVIPSPEEPANEQ